MNQRDLLHTKQKQRMTNQRQVILEEIRKVKTHPTAYEIYEMVRKRLPRISLGTVYRNLTVLMEQGLVQKIDFGSTFDRFEANVLPHYHLICEHCGSVQDFEMALYDELNEKANRLTDFSVQHHRIEFYGICTKCRTGGGKTGKK